MTLSIMELLQECSTDSVLVPSGCNSLVQPIDVVFNKPFKDAVDKLATGHMQDHLHDYLTDKLTAIQRRVLLTKWIGQAWEETSAKKDMRSAEYPWQSMDQKTVRSTSKVSRTTVLTVMLS